MYKFEMHVHTAECDKVAHSSGAEIVRLYKEADYDYHSPNALAKGGITTEKKICTPSDLVVKY